MWTKQEKWLEQVEDKLFDLAGWMVAFAPITEHRPEEEWGLASLLQWVNQLNKRAEKLWKRMAKTWQGINIPESTHRDLEWEAAQEEGHWQALGRGKDSQPHPSTTSNCSNDHGSRGKADATMTKTLGSSWPERGCLIVPHVKESHEGERPHNPHQLPGSHNGATPRICQEINQRSHLVGQKSRANDCHPGAPPEWIWLYREKFHQMGDAITLMGWNLPRWGQWMPHMRTSWCWRGSWLI